MCCYHHLVLRNKVTHVRIGGFLSHLKYCLSGTLTETDCISWQQSKGEKNNFRKAVQFKFLRVEPTDRWQELNVLKKIPRPWLSWHQSDTLPKWEPQWMNCKEFAVVSVKISLRGKSWNRLTAANDSNSESQCGNLPIQYWQWERETLKEICDLTVELISYFTAIVDQLL